MPKKCEHFFEYTDNWKNKIETDGEMVWIPVECCDCGLKAFECYAYSCVIDKIKSREIR